MTADDKARVLRLLSEHCEEKEFGLIIGLLMMSTCVWN
jgi:hypothetical protein